MLLNSVIDLRVKSVTDMVVDSLGPVPAQLDSDSDMEEEDEEEDEEAESEDDEMETEEKHTAVETAVSCWLEYLEKALYGMCRRWLTFK